MSDVRYADDGCYTTDAEAVIRWLDAETEAYPPCDVCGEPMDDGQAVGARVVEYDDPAFVPGCPCPPRFKVIGDYPVDGPLEPFGSPVAGVLVGCDLLPGAAWQRRRV